MHVLLLDSRYDHRRFPFATEAPPFLLPVVHRSLIRATLAWLSRRHLTEVTLVTGRNAAEDYDVAAAVVDVGLRVAPTVQSAIHRAARSRGNEAVLIMRPNLHPLPDLPGIVHQHESRRRAVTVVKGTCVFGPGQYSFGPPAMLLASPGMARLIANSDIERPLLEIPRLARRRKLECGTYDPDVPVVEINNPFSLFQANLDSLRSLGVDRSLKMRGLRQVRPNLWIADGARIEDVRVDPTGGPVVVGRGSVLEQGVLVRGPTVFGRGVNVGRGACVHKGLVLDHVWLAREDFVADSVVSPYVRARVLSA